MTHMTVQQTQAQLTHLSIQLQHITIAIHRSCTLVTACMPAAQAVHIAAAVAAAGASAYAAWSDLDAAVNAIEAIAVPLQVAADAAPAHTQADAASGAAAAQQAMQTVLLDATQRASTCIICQRTGNDLAAARTPWHSNGLCEACAQPGPTL